MARKISNAIAQGAKASKVSSLTDKKKSVLIVLLTTFGDRLLAVGLTILTARILGQSEYGKYNLITATTGLLSGLLGLQLGMFATVEVAKNRTNNAPAAYGVVKWCLRYSIIIGALATVVAPICFAEFGQFVTSEKVPLESLIAAGSIVALGLMTGMQEGVLQGFEKYRLTSKLRLIGALLTTVFAAAGAWLHGIHGTLMGVALASFAKYLMARTPVAKCTSEIKIGHLLWPTWKNIAKFAAPTLSVTLIVSFQGWLGMAMLAQLQEGYDSIAIVGVANQWKTPMIMFATAVGAICIPEISKASQICEDKPKKIAMKSLRWNICVGAVASLLITAFSPVVLGFYGKSYSMGIFSFCIIAFSTVPTMAATTIQSYLIATHGYWLQLLAHVPYFLVSLLLYKALIPGMAHDGYAWTQLSASCVLLACLALAMKRGK